MKRDKYCEKLRKFVAEKLSPTPDERSFVSDVYASVNVVLGEKNTIQIGSFRRFTAIRPLHDLDMLYIIGAWQGYADPRAVLTDLERRLKSEYVGPPGFGVVVSRQTHSITIRLFQGSKEYFSVDIVPAYSRGINTYGEDMYMVPEIIRLDHNRRIEKYVELAASNSEMGWIPSDPRGYNRAAAELNEVNEDFRRTAKFLKGWRAFQKLQDDDFKLKSFHLEQLVYRHFESNLSDDIFGAIFEVMRRLDRYIYRPQIPDRADATRFIDEYVSDLTVTQREKIVAARDGFMIAFENLEEEDDPRVIIEARPRTRADKSESYLFDQGIPVLTEQRLKVIGEQRAREGGWMKRILDEAGLIRIDREIDFYLARELPEVDLYKWKVKNDDSSPQPRGEITDYHTANRPEHTKYRGRHYVECFAIKNGCCIARSHQNVVLDRSVMGEAA